MSERIPKKWKKEPLLKIAQIISGGTPSRYVPAFWDNCDIPWVTPTDITSTSGKYLYETKENINHLGLNSCSARLLPKGTLLMTSRATLGEIKIANREVCTNQGFKSLVPLKNIDNEYLYYQMINNRDKYKIFGIGSTFLEVNKRDTERFEILVAPIETQRRIAEILSTIDEAIEQTEALIKKTRQIKAGLMHDLFTRGVLPNGQLRPTREEAPELYKESPLGWVPKEWEVKEFDDLAVFPTGQVNPCALPFSDWILVAPDHVEKSTGRLLAKYTAREQGAISGKYIFQSNDIVYSKIRPYLRKAILADFQGLCSADMYPLRPKADVDPRYLLGLILGESFSRFTESVSMRSGFPKVNRNELLGYRCAIASYKEQVIVSEILGNYDTILNKTQEEAEKLFQLKNGLMHDLLSGRVAVTKE